MGTKNGIPLTNINFAEDQSFEELPSDSILFVLTPGTIVGSSRRPTLQAALPHGKTIFGYKYTSRAATIERQARREADEGQPKTFTELFPGEFFASPEQRAYDAYISRFEGENSINFRPLADVTLDPDARYIFVVNDAGTTMAVRGLSWCGDGITQEGEECDDANLINDDACTNECRNAACGDGVVQQGEECDDGAKNGNQCAASYGSSCHYCGSDCKQALLSGPRCGDGITQEGEECDDGNSINNDGCGNTCVLPRCGDKIVQAGEACDDGNMDNYDGCTNACSKPACNDGIDNNGDGLIDRNDPGCHRDFNPANEATYLQSFNAEGVPHEDLELSYSGPSDSVAGNTDIFTVTMTNHGNMPVRDPTVLIPKNASYAVNDPKTVGCKTASPTIICSTTVLDPGMTKAFQVAFYTPANIGYCTDKVITTTATLASAGNVDPDPSNDAASVTTVVPCQKADLSVSQEMITGGPHPKPGDIITYAITIKNNGPQIAENVFVVDTISPLPQYYNPTWKTSFEYRSDLSDAECFTAGGNGKCTISSLGPGVSRTFKVSFKVPPGSACYGDDNKTPISFLSTVTTGSSRPDPNPDNSTSTLSTSLYCPQCSDHLDNDANGQVDILDTYCHSDGNVANLASFLPNQDDEGGGHVVHLSVRQDADVGVEFVKPGDTITYVVTVNNDGPDAAKNVVLTERMKSASFERGKSSGGFAVGYMKFLASQSDVRCRGIPDSSVICSFPMIPAGSSQVVRIAFSSPSTPSHWLLQLTPSIISDSAESSSDTTVDGPFLAWIDPTPWDPSLSRDQNLAALRRNLMISVLDTKQKTSGTTTDYNGILGAYELNDTISKAIRDAMSSEITTPHSPPWYDVNFDGVVTQTDIDTFTAFVQEYAINACTTPAYTYTLEMSSFNLPYTAGISLDKNCQALLNTSDPYHALLEEETDVALSLIGPAGRFGQALQCGMCTGVTAKMITDSTSKSYWYNRNFPTQEYYLAPSWCEFKFTGCQKENY
jgi:cysteine-rich repeat protein